MDGPSTVLSAHDGQIARPGTGWFVDDRRVVSVLRVRCDEEPATTRPSRCIARAHCRVDRGASTS
ncbi:glycogen debranching N-terminal domain-containing protein [Ornithinimicrobium flavum]|uniref:glycogen debranching N-terminal domain-containing protein n=1 Tax=Ornithinimicrobium flavum TaxID=1288636 RepID=UPI003B831177